MGPLHRLLPLRLFHSSKRKKEMLVGGHGRGLLVLPRALGADSALGAFDPNFRGPQPRSPSLPQRSRSPPANYEI